MTDDDDDPEPSEPEDLFLIRLGRHLDAAESLSVRTDVMSRLDEVLAHCEAAANLIRQWRKDH